MQEATEGGVEGVAAVVVEEEGVVEEGAEAKEVEGVEASHSKQVVLNPESYVVFLFHQVAWPH